MRTTIVTIWIYAQIVGLTAMRTGKRCGKIITVLKGYGKEEYMSELGYIKCKDCERCRQCFEEDVTIGYREYTKEAYEEFKNKVACNDSFKESK